MADTANSTRDAVLRVARYVQLEGIRLRSMACDAFVEPDVLADDWSDHVFIGVNSERQAWSSEDGALTVRASFIAIYKKGWDPDDMEVPPPFEEEQADVAIEAHFDLDYSLATEGEIEEADLDAFAEMNGTFNAWPYWRELVQSTTQRMGVGNLIVPVYRPATD